MQEDILVRHCSPTLAGLKTANMFTCRYECEKELRCDICRFNRAMSGKGIIALPLRYTDGRALIYIYRPSSLEHDLSSSEACRVLEDCGYCCEGCRSNTGKLLSRLISRLNKEEGFPHEIGLFLGYPPEDVVGFIEKKECTYSGLWKVYGDAEKAKEKFARYQKCTEVYCERWSEGVPLSRLIVKK
ncbi:MAG: DUF3793 family protein [Ruminococcus sp.]|nr:DUF3793 family protein [Ruminococcus sp.]